MQKIIFSILILCLFILPAPAQNIYNGNISIGDSAAMDQYVTIAAANTGFEYRFFITRSFSYIKSFTVGSNVTLVFSGDGYMTMTGATMTVSGAIEAPYVQITDGTITYSSANDEYYNPVWVGSTGNLQYSQGQDATLTNTAAGGATGAKIQISQATTALTGTLIGVRGNARVNTATTSSTGTVQGGKFQAGNASAGYNLATVTGVYVDVVNKVPPDAGDSTVVWTNARGYEVSMDLDQGSASKTNTVTNAYMFYGVYNLPTAGSYSTVTNGYGIFVRNEAVGGTGQMLDAAFYADDLNHSGGIKGWDYGLDFSGISANFGSADIRFGDGATMNNGDANTLTITEATTAFAGVVAIDNSKGTANLFLASNDDDGAAGGDSTVYIDKLGDLYIGTANAGISDVDTIKTGGAANRWVAITVGGVKFFAIADTSLIINP
jgi:hypothetical protein